MANEDPNTYSALPKHRQCAAATIDPYGKRIQTAFKVTPLRWRQLRQGSLRIPLEEPAQELPTRKRSRGVGAAQRRGVERCALRCRTLPAVHPSVCGIERSSNVEQDDVDHVYKVYSTSEDRVPDSRDFSFAHASPIDRETSAPGDALHPRGCIGRRLHSRRRHHGGCRPAAVGDRDERGTYNAQVVLTTL